MTLHWQGNFEGEHFLGEGRFGCVLKGWLIQVVMLPTRPGLGIPVAVKTLNQDGLQGNREWLQWNFTCFFNLLKISY